MLFCRSMGIGGEMEVMGGLMGGLMLLFVIQSHLSWPLLHCLEIILWFYLL